VEVIVIIIIAVARAIVAIIATGICSTDFWELLPFCQRCYY